MKKNLQTSKNKRQIRTIVICLLLVVVYTGCVESQELPSNVPQVLTTPKDTPQIQLVKKYMAHISKGEISEANKLLVTKPIKNGTPDSNAKPRQDGTDLNFPWSDMLHEREFFLEQILDEKEKGAYTEVTAELGVKGVAKAKFIANFRILNQDNNLLIDNIELLPKS